MQMLVSVKNPYDSPALIVTDIDLKAHQIRNDLREAPIPCVQVEREGGDLVDHWDSRRIGLQVDVEQVLAAALARFDADVRKNGHASSLAVAKSSFQPAHDAPALAGCVPLFVDDRELLARGFAAAGTSHPSVAPGGV